MYEKFKVTRASDLFELSGCVGNIDPRCGISDHSILSWTVTTSIVGERTKNMCDKKPQTKVKKYDLKSIPDNFMLSPETHKEIITIIDKVERVNNAQIKVDCLSDELTCFVLKQMDTCIPHTNKCINHSKRSGPHTPKPWWSDELANGWQEVNEAEHSFLAARSVRRNTLRQRYVTTVKPVHTGMP